MTRSTARRATRCSATSCGRPSSSPRSAYGLGVQSVTVDGFPALGHSGRYLGSRAVFRWLPDQGVTIAVLTNQSRADPNPILASLLKIALTPPSD